MHAVRVELLEAQAAALGLPATALDPRFPPQEVIREI